MTEKELLKKSGFYTSFILFFVSLFWLLFSIQISYGGYTGGAQAGIDVGINARATSRMNFQIGTGSTFIMRYGTTTVTGSGTAGYMMGTDSAYPRWVWTPATNRMNFLDITLQQNGVDIAAYGNSAALAAALSDETGTNTVVFSSGSTQTNPTFTGNTNFPSGIWNSSGYIGVGVTAPTDPLTVRKDLAGDQANTLRLENLTAAQAYSGSDIVFIANRTTGGATEYANIRGLINNIGNATYSSDLIFNTAVSGALGERMRINDAGNVGIGTAGPGAKLQIDDTNKTITSDQANLFVYTTNSQAADLGGSIGLGGVVTGSSAFPFGIISGRKANSSDANRGGYLAFATADTDSSYGERMRITNTGNVGIGTAGPADKLTQTGNIRMRSADSRIIGLNTDVAYVLGTSGGAAMRFIIDGTNDEIAFETHKAGVSHVERMRIASAGNVGIGVTSPSNILTLPVSSATDPIADAWTLHCLADYKNMGTETAEMIQNSANEKVKTVPVSVFTKKVIIADEEAEREPRQKYQDKIKESAKADLELYTTETGVTMNNDSYVSELLESMWETKSDRLTIVETNKQKLIAEKKALPKFQRKNYGIVAEDAPPEAQVLREDGSLQGVDTSVLIGILWANAQKQEERISALEIEITSLKQRLQTAGIP